MSEVDYRFVVPPDWTRLPMEPGAMRTEAAAWLLRRYKNLPRDSTATFRRELVEDLVGLTRRAGAEYARMLLVLAMDVQRRPVSASCLVSTVPHALQSEQDLQALADEQGEGAEDVVVGALGNNRGVLVVRDENSPRPVLSDRDRETVDSVASQVTQALGIAHDGLAEPWDPGLTRVVDVWIPVPDAPVTLLLSFSTALVPLFAPLTELFALMAGTVQFKAADGTWS